MSEENNEKAEMKKMKDMIEGNGMIKPRQVPHWPENIEFDQSLASKTGLTLSNLPLRTRVILGLFKTKAFHTRKYKELIIVALDEYLVRHQDEFK